jgi:2Fe-2S ferredoxin
MPTVVFVQPDGAEAAVEAKPGQSLMDAAVKSSVSGIVADCGGACACATCHVYVDEAWREQVGPRTAIEESMLEFADDVRESSRLSCQIKLDDTLDGLRVAVPERQGAIA